MKGKHDTTKEFRTPLLIRKEYFLLANLQLKHV